MPETLDFTLTHVTEPQPDEIRVTMGSVSLEGENDALFSDTREFATLQLFINRPEKMDEFRNAKKFRVTIEPVSDVVVHEKANDDHRESGVI